MLIILGSMLAGALLNNATRDRLNYHVESGEGEIRLPPCELMAVKLGPFSDSDEVILQIMESDSVGGEAEPISDISEEAKYVKLAPTRYKTSVVLRTKRKGDVPITAYYRT